MTFTSSTLISKGGGEGGRIPLNILLGRYDDAINDNVGGGEGKSDRGGELRFDY